jgi:hypothetical protein
MKVKRVISGRRFCSRQGELRIFFIDLRHDQLICEPQKRGYANINPAELKEAHGWP